ncbi:MAG: methyltransferase domain-containing protein [Dehalococcoidia bacterium]
MSRSTTNLLLQPAPSFRDALRGISRRGDYQELLDQDGLPSPALAQNLQHIRLMNRWLGWSAGVWAELAPVLTSVSDRAVLLDIATGSGDVPRSLSRRAARRGIRLTLIGSDLSDGVLRDAKRQSGPSIELVRHDAAALPFADRSVDLVTLCLAAHHLDPLQLTAALGEAWRVARRAVIVSDLERGRLAYAGARLMALVLRNPLTSHDGPISVLRAYTAVEIAGLARRAGLRPIRVRRSVPFRMTLVARKDIERCRT